MSHLVDRAIETAGLGGVLEARRAGASTDAFVERLLNADLLVIGALADRVRAEEVGAEVRVYATAPSCDDDARVFVLPLDNEKSAGLELLRQVAYTRITGPRAARVRVDWALCGLELAQVALGFGASELAGSITTKRGMPIAPGELAGTGKKSLRQLASIVKRNELARCIERGGRVPLFIRADGTIEPIDSGATGTVLEEAI